MPPENRDAARTSQAAPGTTELAELPLLNPDLDTDRAPVTVTRF
jgi:hypothetical protein